MKDGGHFRHKDNQDGVPYVPGSRLDPVHVGGRLIKHLGRTRDGHVVFTQKKTVYRWVLGECHPNCPDSSHNYKHGGRKERPPLALYNRTLRAQAAHTARRNNLVDSGIGGFGHELESVFWQFKAGRREINSLGLNTAGHSVWRVSRKRDGAILGECHPTKCAKCNADEEAKAIAKFFTTKQSKKRKRSTE